MPKRVPKPQAGTLRPDLAILDSVPWNFTGEDTGYATHGFHPYPARFIPQIPRALIAALSQPGDTVLDPFCGCGTTLVEAILGRRNPIGIDANPLAVLISKVKTTPLSTTQVGRLRKLMVAIGDDLDAWYADRLVRGKTPSFEAPAFDGLEFWFKDFVIHELSIIRNRIYELDDKALADFCKVVFSSIVVTVSNQDSDTRYTRREKSLQRRGAFRLFHQRALPMAQRAVDLGQHRLGTARVVHADSRRIRFLDPESVDLVVTSPPYPNAYSYHLYHRSRMLWLNMDPDRFKLEEIGSHRKYSRKNGDTEETFHAEMGQVLSALYKALRKGGMCCVVIGNSIVRGRHVHNDKIIADAAAAQGFVLRKQLEREIQQTKRAFNPKIGRIEREHLLVLEKS